MRLDPAIPARDRERLRGGGDRRARDHAEVGRKRLDVLDRVAPVVGGGGGRDYGLRAGARRRDTSVGTQ